MTTIHIIFHAHLDPIWLWPWQSGLDEAIATCRSACDRLDAHPDLFFSQGEAWVYRQIETVDPPLFRRIAAHIAKGRWEIVGGWWLQPDCNFPSGFALERQIALGKAYFLSRFGEFPTIAFNPDSFGHAATVPAMMTRAGQREYVMMRPGEHEMETPARIFRWRGYEGGPEVRVFRIAGRYETRNLELSHLEASLRDLPDGIDQTMCFCGVGDHGGGPTDAQTAWLREHWEAIPGARVEFSTMRRFFDALADRAHRLPIVTGELQHHAIGCYSVQRSTKTAMRRAEHRLRQAECAMVLVETPRDAGSGRVPSAPAANVDGTDGDRWPAAADAALGRAWNSVCFHQFHDTLGGTCIPSAYRTVDDELGGAAAAADEIVHTALRIVTARLPPDTMQRIVLFNASDVPFSAPVVFEPWLEYEDWNPAWRLIDENGREVPCQFLGSESQAAWRRRILFPLEAAAGAVRTLRIERAPAAGAAATDVRGAVGRPAGKRVTARVVAAAEIDANGFGMSLSPTPELRLGDGLALPLPRLDLIEDPSDTWSHGIDRYGDAVADAVRWEPATAIDRGPLMASLLRRGTIGTSSATAEWRAYAGFPMIELILRITWVERRRLLKLTIELPERVTSREDGIPGGVLLRAGDGRERPVRDFTSIRLESGRQLGIASPDVFALDASARRVRLTLLRSPLMAHHTPHGGDDPRGVTADTGPHEFRFRFFSGASADPERLDVHAVGMQRPLVIADVTFGMTGI